MNKFSDQVTKLTNILTSINTMANKTDALPKYATVMSNNLIQIDGSEEPTPFLSNEETGTRIKIKIENHSVTRVDENTVVENSYDDSDIKESIQNVKDALVDINQRSEDASSDAEDLFDRLTDYLNTLVSGLEDQDDVDDEVGELLDETINDLQDDLSDIEDLVETVKSNAEEASGLAKEAYDAVYPVTSEMRGLLGDLFTLADMETAQTEEISGVYEREGEYSQAKAEYHYNQSKSASRWSQTISAELDAWAKDDPETQEKIQTAQNKLSTANTSLTTAQDAELKAEEKHKGMVKKYNTAYKLYLKAQTEGNTEKINQAKSIVDEASNDIYGIGYTKESFSNAEAAISALENALKKDGASTEVCAGEISQARAELSRFSDNGGSLYALLKARFDTAVAEAEVGTAVNGIHKICSSTIQQKADEILAAVTEETVNGMINQASISIKSETVDTTIKTLKSDGSLAKGTLIHEYEGGSLVCKIGNKFGCLANANGSFDIVLVEWEISTDSDGKTIYTPNVTNSALTRTNLNGVFLHTGESFTKDGIDGMFYVGKTTSHTLTIEAKKGGARLALKRSELMSTYSSKDKAWLISGGFRPISLVRFSTDHDKICKISGWNFNPSVKDDDTTSLTLSVSRNGADSTAKKLDVTIRIQIFWVKCDINRVEPNDLPVDEDSFGNNGVTELIDSSLSGYMKGELNTSSKVLKIYITD